MKNIMFLMFSLIIVNTIFALDITVIHYGGLRLTDNKLYYMPFEDENDYEEYDITWETINKVQYISFNYTGNFLNSSSQTIPNGIKRYLILYGDNGRGKFIFLFDENNICVYHQFNGVAANDVEPTSYYIAASSELAEGNTVYTSRNMLDYTVLKPWVEGSQNNGIGQRIIIESNTQTGSIARDYVSKFRIYTIAISNGFVDYKRPYLYENNNRVKKIRIHRVFENDYIDFELEDTPQIQFCNFFDGAKKIEIEILEVYEGTKWNDTCINKLFPFFSIY